MVNVFSRQFCDAVFLTFLAGLLVGDVHAISGFCISNPCRRCFTLQLVSQALLGVFVSFCQMLVPVLGLFSACLNPGLT